MSAGGPAPRASKDLSLLAPKFRIAVEKSVAECRAQGYDVIVFEAYRSKELQELYYKRGRTIKPPDKPVTNAKSNLYSWHGYGLAVDVISESRGWGPPLSWWTVVASIFKAEGCKWGGDWKARDLPHMQWGRCKPSPSDLARKLIAEGGVEAVWEAVHANHTGAS